MGIVRGDDENRNSCSAIWTRAVADFMRVEVVSEGIQSVERAARVLQVLAAGGWAMGVSEIAQATGLGKSTAHRLLASLTRAEFVRLEPRTRRYSLGHGLMQLTTTWLQGVEIRTAAIPHLRSLRQKTGETVSLNVRDGDSRVAVERLDTSHEIRFVAELGQALPLHIGASGKAILANLPETELHDVLERTVIAKTAERSLRTELAGIRRRGVACTSGERLPGTRSIAAPVFGADGAVVASVSILSIQSRLQGVDEAPFRKLARAAAANISSDLGWSE